jgi:hypothetical protein
MRHISHVGYDGAIFGDLTLYGDISDQLPLKASNGRCKCNLYMWHDDLYVPFILGDYNCMHCLRSLHLTILDNE